VTATGGALSCPEHLLDEECHGNNTKNLKLSSHGLQASGVLMYLCFQKKCFYG